MANKPETTNIVCRHCGRLTEHEEASTPKRSTPKQPLVRVAFSNSTTYALQGGVIGKRHRSIRVWCDIGKHHQEMVPENEAEACRLVFFVLGQKREEDWLTLYAWMAEKARGTAYMQYIITRTGTRRKGMTLTCVLEVVGQPEEVPQL